MGGRSDRFELMSEIPEASIIEIGLLLFGLRSRYRVEGDSMLPLLENGEVVLVKKGVDVNEDDVVIAQHPHHEEIEMVKRIAGIHDKKFYSLLGDNPEESSDSREFGLVEEKLIIGKVVCKLR